MNKVIEIKFDSDWHIGSGAGIPGSVDRTVLRDADGLPYVPGKTLTGILRDSAEFVVEARGQVYKDALESLFGGQPAQGEKLEDAKIGISDAVFSDELKEVLRSHEALKQALFIVQPGIKIDRATGRTEDKHLFSREEVRGGCTLRANVMIEDSLSPEEETLLGDAIKATRRIGGHRRRGGGRCKLSIEDVPAGPHNTQANIQVVQGNQGTLTLADGNATEVELEYALETLQPVIINRVTLGNVVQSESFIPGTYLLSFFAKKLSAAGLSKEIGKAIGSGEFSVGPFYPEMRDNIAYPVPLSFSERKAPADDGWRNIFNRLSEKPPENIQMKDVRSGFVVPHRDGNNSVPLYSANDATIYRTHNTVDDATQHPTEKSGGPYTYQAIKPGAKFRGTLRISGYFYKTLQGKPEIVKTLEFETCASMGQSKKDEYGRVKITFAKKPGAVTIESNLLKEKYLVVYLASDVLVRNKDTLAFTGSVDDFKDEVANLLGVSLKDVDFDKENPLGGDRGHCVRFGRRESWHTKWVLPRPSLVYLQAGSVFLFEAKNSEEWRGFDWDAASRKLFMGIGDRRAEGYGRVLLNPKFLCDGAVEISRTVNDQTPVSHEAQDENQGGNRGKPAAPQSEDDRNFLGLLKKERMKDAFRKSSRRVVADFVLHDTDHFGLFQNVTLKKGAPAPTTSQFGILREVAAAIAEVRNVSPVRRLLDPQAARSQFTKAWGENWIVWLENVTGGQVDLWKIIGGDEIRDDALENEMNIFAISTLLDVFCEAVFDKHLQEGQQ
jgi:CRISPR-associated protein Csx10